MASLGRASQVHVGYGLQTASRRANKVVRKWSEEQTDQFAVILSARNLKDGENCCWAEELETLAVKKSSNEKMFKEIQAHLEEELVRIDQSLREDEATFSVPQLRAKYKWLKREWRLTQNKMSYGLLGRGEVKTPTWYKVLDPIFSVCLDLGRDDRDKRPSMVKGNGAFQNDETSGEEPIDTSTTRTDAVTVANSNAVRSGAVNKRAPSALNRAECIVEHVQDDEDIVESGDGNSSEMMEDIHVVRIQTTQRNGQTPKRVSTTNEDFAESLPSKIRKSLVKTKTNNDHNSSVECVTPHSNGNQCACRSDSDRYVEIIRHLLDAEERRERMFVAFQREQAEANRQHELKMAQFFAQSSSQQHVLTGGISQIIQLLSSRQTGSTD